MSTVPSNKIIDRLFNGIFHKFLTLLSKLYTRPTAQIDDRYITSWNLYGYKSETNHNPVMHETFLTFPTFGKK